MTLKNIGKKRLFTLISIALAVIALILFLVAPLLIIDRSYAGKEALDAGKLPDEFRSWSYLVGTFAAMFGGSSYEVWTIQNTSKPYEIAKINEQMSFNPMILIGVIVLVATLVAQIIIFAKKKKSLLASRLLLAGYIVAALMIVLSAVWFYAMNPIEESNYYNTVTKLDTVYKYVNAHLSAGPIISTVLLVGSSIFTTIGE